MIVMHPNQVIGSDQRCQGRGEQVVYPAVSLEFGPFEVAQADLVVQDGPERVVGEATIVLVVVLAGQVDGKEGDRTDISFEAGSFRLWLAGGGDFAAPAEPQSALLIQRI